MTSGGHHCTERCQVSTRVIGGEELDNVYTCPVVNGVSLEHVAAGHSESGRPNSDYDDPEDRELSEDDKYFWDWCTPSVTEELVSDENDDDDDELGTMDPAPLPDSKIFFMNCIDVVFKCSISSWIQSRIRRR